ncbi:hypothetical protein KI387_039769, partial [Taxus chinensis]
VSVPVPAAVLVPVVVPVAMPPPVVVPVAEPVPELAAPVGHPSVPVQQQAAP